jgi:hypothetical protein
VGEGFPGAICDITLPGVPLRALRGLADLHDVTRGSTEPAAEAERAALARVRQFQKPEFRPFVDVVTKLVEADLDPTRNGEDASELFAELYAAMYQLWPNLWAFRGAEICDSGDSR